MTTAEEKKNPHLEELAEIITFTEANKDGLNSETLTKKLKKLHSGMDDSPLVLKMRARGLSVVNSDSYKSEISDFVEKHDWHWKNEQEMIFNSLLDMVELTYWALEAAQNNGTEEEISRTLRPVLWMMQDYVRNYVAMRKLEPEEAAVACLSGTGPSIWGNNCFETFSRDIEEAEEENTGGKGGNKDGQ